MSKIVIVSGYFNPIHVGHLDYIEGAKRCGDKVIAIVNNDAQVALKGSTPFLTEKDRVRIVGALEAVDEAVLSIDTDATVVETLSMLKDVLVNDSPLTICRNTLFFANGGDRNDDVPEIQFCKENDIAPIFHVGGQKTQSSSTLLAKVRSQ